MFEYDKNGNVIGATNRYQMPHGDYHIPFKTKMSFGSFLRKNNIILSHYDNEDKPCFVCDLRHTKCDSMPIEKIAYLIANIWKANFADCRTLEIYVVATDKIKTHYLGKNVSIEWRPKY